MAEAVGLASGLWALTVLAFKASQALHEAVSSFKSQRQSITELLSVLDGLVAVLTTIREQAQRPTEVAKLELLRQPLECCAAACKEMHEMLDACTAHSKDGQPSVRDWLAMKYREKSFDDLKNRLSIYKTTLLVAFQSVNIQDHSVTQESIEDMKNLMRGIKEDLEDQLDEVQQSIRAAEASSLKVHEEDQTRLQSALDSIALAQRMVENRPHISIMDNCIGQGSRVLMGTDTPEPAFNLTVARNEIGVAATYSAGVHSPQVLQALLQNATTPNLALALQALQTQPFDVRSEAVQSALNAASATRNVEAPHVHRTLLTTVDSSDSAILEQEAISVEQALS